MQNKTIEQAEKMFGVFHHALTDKSADVPENLGKLAALMGVKEFPSRIKCATLAWHALHEIIEKHLAEVDHAV